MAEKGFPCEKECPHDPSRTSVKKYLHWSYVSFAASGGKFTLRD